MTKAAWFNINGKFNYWDEHQQPSAQDIEEGYVKADIDETLALWRFTYNSETNSVDVYQPTMTDAEAEVQLRADQEAADTAAAAAEAE